MNKFLALLLTALLTLTTLALPAYADTYAYVSAGAMTVYSDKALTKRVGSLSQNTVTQIAAESNGVAKIRYNGKTGYVNAKDLSSLSTQAQTATVNTASRVYKSASTSSDWTSLKKGTTVNFLTTRGDWAVIERGGNIGYTKASHLSTGAQSGDDTPSSDLTVLKERFTATVTADSLAVYQKTSTSSARLGTLKNGATVSVSAYNDTWAQVVRNGDSGYVLRSGISRTTAATQMPTAAPPAAPTQTPTPTPVPTASPAPTVVPVPSATATSTLTFQQALSSGKYSNEKIIYIFLTTELGLNTAAACGLLANIYSESTFNPTAYNAGGGSYGLCQWTGARYTKLINYCREKGYDYTSLKGQLYYLGHELKNSYPSTWSYLKGVENSASGAYNAGHYFCYNFEVPANRASVSVTRGNNARNTYWPKYKK